MLAIRTSIESDAVSVPSLVVITVALLSTGLVPAVAAVVPLVMWTQKLPWYGREARSQVSDPAAMAHVGVIGSLWSSIDQLVPGSVGRRSSTWTPVAVPSPVLVTVIVKPIVSPAMTLWSSATFSMSMAAQLTVVVAEAVLPPSLAEPTVALFG